MVTDSFSRQALLFVPLFPLMVRIAVLEPAARPLSYFPVPDLVLLTQTVILMVT